MFSNVINHLTFWKDSSEKKTLESIESPQLDDGATEVESHESNIMSTAFSMADHNIYNKNTRALINTYRELMNIHEVENAVEEIVSDAVVADTNRDICEVSLDGTKFSDNIKYKIIEEFNTVLGLYDFNLKGMDHFKRWYVDSRIYFQKIIDPKKPKLGIQELRRLDPRKMELVREVVHKEENGVKVVVGYNEYFKYEQTSGNSSNQYVPHIGRKVEMPRESVVYAHSGLLDCSGDSIIGYLHRAVKPANQLKLLEDAMMVNRIVRAPERRMFFIDTGNMPAKRAEQYITYTMNRFKNKIVYDSTTGKIKNGKTNMSMTEDFWLQRRDGKAVTDVQPLPGASNLDQIEDVFWFNKKLYEALRVPPSRLTGQDNQSPLFSNGVEITRDELKFAKFIDKLRKQFQEVFIDPLRTNLILKGIITEAEWEENKHNINIIFHNDSNFEETKYIELMERRVQTISQMSELVGVYFSHNYVMKNILNMSDEEIKEQEKIIKEESKDERFKKNDDSGGW